MFCIQPALKKSFVEVFFGLKEDPEEDSKTEPEESGQKGLQSGGARRSLSTCELARCGGRAQEVDELKEEPKPETLKEKPEDSGDPKPDSGDPKAADAKNRASAKSAAESADGTKNRASAVSAKTAKSEEGGRTYGRSSNPSRKGWERRMRSSGASFRASSHSKASAATNPAPGGGTRAPPPVAVDPESKIPVAQCRQVLLVPVLPKEPVTANRPRIQDRQCYQQSPA